MKNRLLVLNSLLICSISFAGKNLVRGQWQSSQSNSHTSSIEYLIFIPKVLTANSTKLMISLHGCSQVAQDLADLGNWEDVAEENSMIVVLPKVPNGGVIAGCWDYYGKNHSEANRNNGPLLELTHELLQNPEFGIAKNQVYISGISSGAGEAAVLGCLRPDIFSGVGLNSSPAVGTEMGEISSPNSTSEEVAQTCENLAGSFRSELDSQKLAIIYDDHDYIVNSKHSVLISNAMQSVFKTTSHVAIDMTQLKGTNKNGSGFLYLDSEKRPRLSVLMNSGLGHGWASGKGQGTTQHFVNPKSINFPAFLAQFFSHSSLQKP